MLALNPIKNAFVILVCLLGLLINVPNFMTDQVHNLPGFFPSTQISLGLDLRGGSSLLLEVGLKKALEERYLITAGQLNVDLKKYGVEAIVVPESNDDFSILVNIVPNQKSSASLILEQVQPHVDVVKQDYDINHTSVDKIEKIKIVLKDPVRRSFVANVFNQSIELIRKRVDENGTLEPNIQKHGDNYILVELPNMSDPSKISKLLGQTAKLEFKIVKNFGDRSSLKPNSTSQIVPYKVDGKIVGYYELDNKKVVPGDTLSNAQISYDDRSNPSVAFMFNTSGTKLFGDLTKNNIGGQLAIVLDNVVISAPKISTPITGGHGTIAGNFSVQEASDLSLLLRSGSLPAPLKVVEQRIIGPDLGSDSIYRGSLSTIVAILVVCVFMFLSYSLFGLFANIAVLFNLVLLLATMTLFGVTLTLPGMTGIALTVGMAVDANVLIYERIKEELAKGTKVYAAIEAGYDRAVSTIVDSNVTTIIVAILLYYFGSGPVRGFAVTLILGIVISMFTAISLTKLIISKWLNFKRRTNVPI